MLNGCRLSLQLVKNKTIVDLFYFPLRKNLFSLLVFFPGDIFQFSNVIVIFNFVFVPGVYIYLI